MCVTFRFSQGCSSSNKPACMTFILVPTQGEDVQVNAWNWRPTVELLRAEGLLTEENYERMTANGCGGEVDATLASRIVDVVERKLATMKPGERIRADLTITATPKAVRISIASCRSSWRALGNLAAL